MQLTGPQSQRFSEALRDAFTLQTFERTLWFMLNRRLDDLAAPGDAQQVVFRVIDAFNREDQMELLIEAARAAAPTNSKLYVFSQQFGLASTKRNQQELERIVRDANGFLDPDRFRSRLGALERRVCRLEIESNDGRIFGTGFLVGKNVVMTNHHVIACLMPTNAATSGSARALARFDHRRMYDPAGRLLPANDGRVCAFADNFLIDASPNTADGQLPKEDELDYALIRLAEEVGEDLLDKGANMPEPQKRGFIEISSKAITFEKNSSLFILQHPRGEPLKLALETKSVLGLFDAGLRVRYTTNTEPGSSGSPCFTPDWELAALHHSGDPDFDLEHKPTYNEGIPMVAIVSLIQKRGKDAALGQS